MVRDHQGDIVDLGAVRHGEDRAVRGFHPERLVVENPVAEPGQAGFADIVQSVVSLAAARTEPAGRPLAGEFFDHVAGLPDDGALILDLLDRHLHISMRHEFPSGVARRSGDLGISLADLGVDRQGRGHARGFERAQQAPEADPHAVFVPGPVRHVGNRRLAHRRLRQLPRHRSGDVPFLDIDHRPDDHARPAGQLERRPGERRRIGQALARQHHDRNLIAMTSWMTSWMNSSMTSWTTSRRQRA